MNCWMYVQPVHPAEVVGWLGVDPLDQTDQLKNATRDEQREGCKGSPRRRCKFGEAGDADLTRNPDLQ